MSTPLGTAPTPAKNISNGHGKRCIAIGIIRSLPADYTAMRARFDVDGKIVNVYEALDKLNGEVCKLSSPFIGTGLVVQADREIASHA